VTSAQAIAQWRQTAPPWALLLGSAAALDDAGRQLAAAGVRRADLGDLLLAALPEVEALARRQAAEPACPEVRAALSAAFAAVAEGLAGEGELAIGDLELALAERLPVEELRAAAPRVLFLAPGGRRQGRLRLYLADGLPGVPPPLWMDNAEHVWEVRHDAA
jgi:hypothetical protein